VDPTFVAGYYSVDIKALVLRFTETVSATVDLTNIKVHAAGKDPVALGGDAKVAETPTDTVKITGLSTEAQDAIAAVGNPQVDIPAGAVKDLAGNPIAGILNRQILYDTGGPSLSTAGNIYEHISLDDTTLVSEGKLTLAFNEIVDVSSITDVTKIKLEAGTTSVTLDVATVLDPDLDSSTVKI
jgi:hypothetical protein